MSYVKNVRASSLTPNTQYSNTIIMILAPPTTVWCAGSVSLKFYHLSPVPPVPVSSA